MLATRLKGAAKISYAEISVVQSGGAVEGDAGAITLTGIQTDDVIFMLMANVGTTFTAPTGYTEVANNTLVSGYSYRYYYKVMGATPDSTISVTDSNNDGTAYAFYVLRNVNTTTPILTSATATGTTNCPSVITNRNSMIIAAGFGGNGSGSAFTAAPSGYLNFQTFDATAQGDANVAGATKYLSDPATEDPGAWTGTLNWSGQAAVTIATNPRQLFVQTLVPTYIGTTQTNSAATTQTLTSVSIGAESSSRRVVVALSSVGTSAGFTFNSVTIGGVSAIEHVENGGEVGVAIYSLDVSSGTTADIVITGNANFNVAAHVFTITGNSSVIDATASATASATSVTTSAINVTAENVGIYVATCQSADAIYAPTSSYGYPIQSVSTLYTANANRRTSAGIVTYAGTSTSTITTAGLNTTTRRVAIATFKI